MAMIKFSGIGMILAIAIGFQTPTYAQFDQYFRDITFRIDYHHTGHATQEIVSIDELYSYGKWAGSMVHLIDDLNYGKYYYKIYDARSGKLIYSKGFGSYFQEYQLSTDGLNEITKSFHETALLPHPKEKIIFTLEKRQNNGEMEEIFRQYIDPNGVNVISQQGPDPLVTVYKSLQNGPPNTHADIAIIAEGYSVNEKEKFRADLERFTNIFFSSEPCKSMKHHFNVSGVFKPSPESGVDEPTAGSFKNTILEASFNSLGSERYLLVEDNKTLRDIAGHVPYDAIYIMVNHDRYGGGGIYNFYCTFTSDNIWSPYLMVHEFGHSFFGLADEYYTSSTAYTDFYPAGYEPSEPNITALLDPDNLKWKHLVDDGTPIPTPWNKEAYDKFDSAWQENRSEMNAEISRLRRSGADEDTIQEAVETYGKRDKNHVDQVKDMLKENTYYGKVGAFEGAGYTSEGLYRPSIDCIMFSKGTDSFCPVCQEAMRKIIQRYAE